MAHTLAHLRFAGPVAGPVARLTTGSGSTWRRRLLPPAGRVLHPLDDKSKFQGDITSSYPNRPAGPGRTENPIRVRRRPSERRRVSDTPGIEAMSLAAR